GLPRRRDRHVGVTAAALADGDRAVVDVDLPLSRALDVEDVGVRHPGRFRRIGPGRKAREEVLNGVGHPSSFCSRSAPEPNYSSSSMSTVPPATRSPSLTWTARTVASYGEASGVSIFIASRTTRSCRAD